MPVVRPVVDLHHRKRPDTSLLSPNDQPPRSPSPQWRERQHKWAGRRSPSVSCDARDVHHAAMRKAQQSRHELRLATRNPQILAASLPQYSYFVRIVIQTRENTHQATHSQQQTVDRTQFVDAVRVEAATSSSHSSSSARNGSHQHLVDARMPVDAPPWWTCTIARDRTRRSLAQMISHLDLRVHSGESDNTSGPGDARHPSPATRATSTTLRSAKPSNAATICDPRPATRKYSPPVYQSTRISSE